jgi:AraC-like DNA-binding protein
VATDVLSDVLRAVHLTGAVFFHFDLSSPWVMEAPASRDIAGIVMPGAQRVIEYHLVMSGSCWANAIGDEPTRLREGDIIVFPQGAAHVLASAPGMRSRTRTFLYRRPPNAPTLRSMEVGGGGLERARIMCCFLGCDERPFNPLLTALPKVIHLAAEESPSSSTAWLATLLGLAAKEAGDNRAGSENVLSRLSELLFVETIRRYLETLTPAQTGWLSGLRDPEIGRALAAMHRDPRAPWTVESLAREVGVSRSVFAERFTEMVGETPMQYLALWRMQLASRLLVKGGQVAGVADAVGYTSEAAFSRAFKKLVGRSPATWRRANRASGSGV